MKVKAMLIGDPGVGKTHTCVNVAQVVPSIILDTDDGAEEIVQKLNADVTVYPCLTWNEFVNNLRIAVKTDARLVIIDSLTELKNMIKWHIKNKIVQKGEFYIGGVERDEPKKIADKDLFVLTWELHPPVYDKVRDVLRAILSSGKSYMITYHPAEKSSKGEVHLLNEWKRICNIVARVDYDTVTIEKDRFWNLKELSRNDFIEYLKTLITAENMDETKEFIEGLI